VATTKKTAKKDEGKPVKAKDKGKDKGKPEQTKSAKNRLETDETDEQDEAIQPAEESSEVASAKAADEPALEEAKPTKTKSSSAKVAREPSSQAKVYQPANSYVVGEQIFHPVWKTEGTVVEIGKTPDGHCRIVVDFPDLGVKRLVAEHNLKI